MSQQETVNRYRGARSDRALAVLEGFHALKHALRFDAEVLEAVSPDPPALLGLAEELAPDVREEVSRTVSRVPADLYRRLAPRPPDSGVIALARRPPCDPEAVLEEAPGPAVLLEAPSHLGNLGAAVRVAAAAGAAGLLATGEHDPWHPSALRGSAGLHFAVPVAAVEDLPGSGRPLVALDPAGEPLDPASVPPHPLLVFGSERRGLRPETLERADLRVRLPMREGVSSLNLATSVAAVLYGLRLPGSGRGGGRLSPADGQR